MFANNLSCVYKICRTHPHPAPPSLHLLRPESACLLTSNPPLLNTFEICICKCACDCIWICICQNCDVKKHDKDIYMYEHLRRARTDPAGWLLTWNSPPEASPSSQFKWIPPPPLHQDSSAVYERWDVRQSCPGQPVVATVGKAGGRSVQCSPSTLAALVRPVLCPPPPHKDGRYCAALSLRAQLAVVPYTLPLLHCCIYMQSILQPSQLKLQILFFSSEMDTS